MSMLGKTVTWSIPISKDRERKYVGIVLLVNKNEDRVVVRIFDRHDCTKDNIIDVPVEQVNVVE